MEQGRWSGPDGGNRDDEGTGTKAYGESIS